MLSHEIDDPSIEYDHGKLIWLDNMSLSFFFSYSHSYQAFIKSELTSGSIK